VLHYVTFAESYFLRHGFFLDKSIANKSYPNAESIHIKFKRLPFLKTKYFTTVNMSRA